jgi:hypothetical protein
MEKELTQTVKPRFYEVCQSYGLDYQAMEGIAKKARLSKCVIDAMAVSKAIRRVHAEKILAALSEQTNQTYTLNNVKVALLPTFADFHRIHQFDLAILSTTSGVPFDLICMMLDGKAVPMGAARLILGAASSQTGQKYTVDNVDVNLTDGE